MDLSDEEKHALELRRERSNKISKTMGEYLLKGYKMLGTSCNKCGVGIPISVWECTCFDP